jgi:hypothetical protein
VRQTEAAIKANAEVQAGYKDGMRFLRAAATSFGAALLFLADEDRVLCVDGSEGASLYNAGTHSVLTVPSLRAGVKGRDAISVPVPC